MALDYSDRTDFDNATRGLVARLEPGHITNQDGRTVYDADIYAQVTAGECPDTVHPSLWRQSQLTAIQGLFEVTEGIYQLRGIELSNMTVVEGETGVIIIDPAVSAEVAAAGLRLYRQHRGDREVRAVIFTHSHIDHFGGVLGVVDADTDVPIVAPAGFLDHAVSENVYAGNAMLRRGTTTRAAPSRSARPGPWASASAPAPRQVSRASWRRPWTSRTPARRRCSTASGSDSRSRPAPRHQPR
jgi:alkyl sulfatase BDS1-like metallo-beta-lactamase superfamily hydrolase